MKKFSLILALAMALTLTIGVSVALAAPGNYPPGTQTTNDKYTTTLDSTMGQQDATSWGLSNGLGNANETGKNLDVNDGTSFNDVIKNVGGERTHGEYANDTNSCASCHQTHTASGKTLLFRNGVYNTCTACHDGTLGAYNVFNASNAGTFGGNPDKGLGNASVHLATGVMTTAAAPGGNRSSNDAETWGKEFTCASCHAPHGSYSDRLLNFDPNGINHVAPTDEAGNATGGRLMVGNSVIQQSVTLPDGTAVANAYVASKDGTTKIAGPYLYGYTYAKPKQYWSRLWYDANGNGTMDVVLGADGKPTTGTEYFAPNSTSQAWNDVVQVNYRSGFFTDNNNVISTNTIDITKLKWNVAPATIVKLTTAQDGTLANGWPILKVTGYTSGVNSFCAACHTDYNSNSAQTETGTFSKAFRHKITQGLKAGMIGEGNSMVCLTCHFAHGTDKSLQKDARDVVGQNLDVNASSALKRYVNMSVCWKCHTDSHSESLTNNDSFWDKVDGGTAPIVK